MLDIASLYIIRMFGISPSIESFLCRRLFTGTYLDIWCNTVFPAGIRGFFEKANNKPQPNPPPSWPI
jgi:hypothetical protein